MFSRIGLFLLVSALLAAIFVPLTGCAQRIAIAKPVSAELSTPVEIELARVHLDDTDAVRNGAGSTRISWNAESYDTGNFFPSPLVGNQYFEIPADLDDGYIRASFIASVSTSTITTDVNEWHPLEYRISYESNCGNNQSFRIEPILTPNTSVADNHSITITTPLLPLCDGINIVSALVVNSNDGSYTISGDPDNTAFFLEWIR